MSIFNLTPALIFVVDREQHSVLPAAPAAAAVAAAELLQRMV
jgi:hypothetical protein